MNDFSEIESELKKLRPAPVEPNLVTRIEKALLEESSLPTAAVVARKRSKSANWISLGLGLGPRRRRGLSHAGTRERESDGKESTSVAAVKPSPNERPVATTTINPLGA